MAHTNSTENYGLPQWIGTDKPTFLGDFNTAFGTIDTQMKANSDAATTAVATANSADATATSANTNATTALNTANSAATDAATAVSTASTANSTANTAKTNADAALRASAANTIENLAPAYDPTLTYAVGDLVTYIDAQNSGKLYKCIVPVNTPMEFNVNYWDDVTTSEVYARPVNLVYRTVADGVKTTEEIFNEIHSHITSLSNYAYLKVVSLNGSTNYNKLHGEFNSTYTFTWEYFSTNDFGGHEYVLKSSGSTAIQVVTTSGGSTTITNLSNNTPASGIIYELYN